MHQTWIFNCNPNDYDLPRLLVEGGVRVGSVEKWWAKQRKAEMVPGDRIYHWVTGPAAGLYAVSNLASPAYQEGGDSVVDVRFERILEPPVLRKAVEAVPDLAGLTVVKVPRQTNYLLDPVQALALDRLCEMPEQWPFESAALARVLRLDPEHADLRTREGWQRVIGEDTRGFLAMVEARVLQERPDVGRFRRNQVEEVRRGRQVLARLFVPGGSGLPDLELALGLDDRSGQRTHHLFAGISLWGPARAEADLEGRLRGLELLRTEDSVYASDSQAFTGRTVRAGLFLTPEEVEALDPVDLVDRVVRELVKWSGRLAPSHESSSLLQSWSRCCLDLEFQEKVARRRKLRRERLPLIAERLQDLQAGRLGLREFVSWMDGESKNNSHWGFKSIAGQMFLNILGKLETTDPSLLSDYCEALRVPEDDQQARERLERMAGRVTSLKGAWAKAGLTPAYLPYNLSFFWQVQDRRRWPVYWSQTLAPLLERLGLLEPPRDPAVRYVAYLEAARTLRKELEGTAEWDDAARDEPWWAVEEFAIWMKERPVPRPPERDLVTRLQGWFEAHRLRFPRSVLTTYALALQSKPFVILSGLSGTGKTKLARLFAEFISPSRLVEEEAAVTEGEGTVLFSQAVRPTLQRHRRLHIPLQAWQHFPPLAPGESEKISLTLNGSPVPARLHNFRIEGRPEGVMQVYLPAEASEWIRSQEVGSTLRWSRTGNGYRVDRDTGPRLTRRTRRSHFAFVPVRPDWTDPRGLLGFPHLLTGTYQSTDFLRTLLQAATDPGRPYFVLLDEMNLARVEHYFSDFLSALESRRTWKQDGQEHRDQDAFPLHSHPRCMLNTGDEERAEEFFGEGSLCNVKCPGCPFAEFVDEAHHGTGTVDFPEAARAGFTPTSFTPPRLKVPWNVHFTGTVNVDETTFTFSPKVLDRASVLEFRHVDLEGYFASQEPSSEPERASVEDLARWTQDGRFPFVDLGRSEETRRQPALAPYRLRLATLSSLLVEHDLHFGYRVADEIMTFLESARRLADPEFPLANAFDQALLLKILPRFHGSRARLLTPLIRLLAFCVAAGDEGEDETVETLAQKVRKLAESLEEQRTPDPEGELAAQVAYPGAARKVSRLLRDLEVEGFAGSM